MEMVSTMQGWTISLEHAAISDFSQKNHRYVSIQGFMKSPETAIESAYLQNFAKITPQYPGIRAPLPEAVSMDWAKALAPMLDSAFGNAGYGWDIQAWFSLVTAKPNELIPLQCFPHVDGTDPDQLAMMLYLDRTDHGGTAFFRHRATGLEALTADTFPQYREALQSEVARTGLPKPAYVTDGAPHFERIHHSEGAFNQAIFYRGNVLHSGNIRNDVELSDDPKTGRLTINAFFRPRQSR